MLCCLLRRVGGLKVCEGVLRRGVRKWCVGGEKHAMESVTAADGLKRVCHLRYPLAPPLAPSPAPQNKSHRHHPPQPTLPTRLPAKQPTPRTHKAGEARLEKQGCGEASPRRPAVCRRRSTLKTVAMKCLLVEYFEATAASCCQGAEMDTQRSCCTPQPHRRTKSSLSCSPS